MMMSTLISLLTFGVHDVGDRDAQPQVSTQTERWATRQQWPLKFAAGLDALGFFPQAAHASVVIGTELSHARRNRFTLLQPIEVAYLVHRRFAHGPSLRTGVGVRWTFAWGLDLGTRLSLGVQHTFIQGASYVRDARGYGRGPDPGRTSANVGVGGTIGYDFAQRTRVPLRIFARYQQVLLAPFAANNGIPVMGRAQVLLGVAVPLRRSEVGT